MYCHATLLISISSTVYKELRSFYKNKLDTSDSNDIQKIVDLIAYIIRERNLKRTYYGNFKQTVARPLAALVKPITSMMSWRQ